MSAAETTLPTTRTPRLPVHTGFRRRDAWWLQPAAVVVVLTGFGLYSLWAALQNANYYAEPYLSPFYSPCIAANCAHATLPVIGRWWTISPAFLILWIPLAFRATCYYYRKAYYRSFFWSPPACAIPDARQRYGGETRFPWTLQNLHRYAFYLSVVVVLFLWWDALRAFVFPTGIGIGLGTIVLVANAALLSLYTFSCHSCRHLCGGYLDTFKRAPTRYRIWRAVSRLNERHPQFAWVSLFGVALADLYVRAVAAGLIADPRIVL
ncbi:MAG TPA: succinate dehydrogenase [Chloroflexota bacterium]|nr:succinate dehydrogenase [Chloroflexota bacterium]